MANMAQAIRMALAYGEKHLGVTDVFGEDVGPPLGGVFTATHGVRTSWYSPLDERGIIDPTKVVRIALETAVAVAGTLLLAEATMVEVEEESDRVPVPEMA